MTISPEADVEGTKHQRQRVFSNILLLVLFENTLLHIFCSSSAFSTESFRYKRCIFGAQFFSKNMKNRLLI